jgi:hypothetical protein
VEGYSAAAYISSWDFGHWDKVGQEHKESGEMAKGILLAKADKGLKEKKLKAKKILVMYGGRDMVAGWGKSMSS